jgi:acyl-CoA thioester hydrolase
MTTPDFRHTLRVYWEDTDAGGVVFYANYLKFFERARSEWLRTCGFGQERLRLDTGVMFVVTDTAVRYRQPARLDDVLEISVDVTDARLASLHIRQQAWRPDGSGGEAGPVLLAEGTIRIGCVDAGTFRPRRIPIHVFDRIR